MRVPGRCWHSPYHRLSGVDTGVSPETSRCFTGGDGQSAHGRIRAGPGALCRLSSGPRSDLRNAPTVESLATVAILHAEAGPLHAVRMPMSTEPPRTGMNEISAVPAWLRARSCRSGRFGEFEPHRASGPSGHGRPFEDRCRQARRPRLRLPALRGRRPLPLRLRRAARRPGRRDRGGGAETRDRAPLLARPGPARGGDERQRLPQFPLLRGRPGRPRCPPHPTRRAGTARPVS